MTFAEVLKLLLLVSIFLNVFALALRADAGDAFYLFRNWRLGLRAFLAMFVVVPAAAILIAYSFDLKPAVKIALVALAFSPVPPLLPKKLLKAGVSGRYVTGLLVAASLAALVVTPLGLLLAGAIFSVNLHMAWAGVVRTLAIGIAAPLIAGLAGRKLLGERAPRLSEVLGRFAGTMLLLCVLALLVGVAPSMWAVIGDGTVIALAAMILAGLAASYWIANNDPAERAALSLTAATRHPGVAIGIASANLPGEKLAPAAILLFAILNALIFVPYLRWLKKDDATGNR